VATGATTCSVEFLLMTGGLSGNGASIQTVVTTGLMLFAITWLVAAAVFSIGLVLVGLPAWMGLEKLGWVSPTSATASGSLLAAAVAGLFGGPMSAAFLILPGAAAGWMLHHVAYGQARRTAP
jgi:hypothetical protein